MIVTGKEEIYTDQDSFAFQTQRTDLIKNIAKDLTLSEEDCLFELGNFPARDLLDSLVSLIKEERNNLGGTSPLAVLEKSLGEKIHYLYLSDLARLINAYRCNSLREEGLSFLASTITSANWEALYLKSANRLTFLKELGEFKFFDFDLIDKIIFEEMFWVDKFSLGKKAHFLECLGLCHSKEKVFFKSLLNDLVDSLHLLKPNSVTSLLIGCAEINYIEEEKLKKLLRHLESKHLNYTTKQRATAFRCIVSLANHSQVLRLWRKIGDSFFGDEPLPITASQELMTAFYASAIDISKENHSLLRYKRISSVSLIDEKLYQGLNNALQGAGINYEIRKKIASSYADYAFEYNGNRFALLIDSPTKHRIGGIANSRSCGSELLRERVIMIAGYIVLRVSELPILDLTFGSRLQNFLEHSDFKKSRYFFSA